MRKLPRAVIAPVIAVVLALGCVSFAMATGSYNPPPATHNVYPCVPDHTGSHGGDYGNWWTWWSWLKSKYGDQWANALKAKYGSTLDKYIAAKYANSSSTSTYYGHDDDDDECEPECPDGKASSQTMSTSTYGSHHDDDDCKPECPKEGSSKTMSTSTYGSWHDDEDECEPECPDKSSSYSTSTHTYGGSYGGGGSSTGSKCKPPDAETGGCSGCKPTAMTITGTVDPNGRATQYRFEYGTTAAFGSTTAWKDAGDGDMDKSVSTELTGLAAGTKIYYRIVAKSDRGTTSGSTRYCSTAAASKPAATTGNASSIYKNTATVNGTVDPNGASTTVYFQYGKTSSLGSTSGSQSAGSGDSGKSVSTGLSGLSSNTKYYYRVVASNSKGSSSGSVLTFTTSR